ncbi:MAG: protease inhibitor I42 family protein, partial [Anaerolineae bacterium]|nr:protease inhibitor I42 family protein [Anaerolineae bacterium]
MMKHRAWVWTLLLLLMVMLGQGARAERPTPPPLVEVPVTEADIGQPIALAADELLVLTLEANPSTGYRWEVAAADAGIVQLVAGYEFVQSAPGYGQAGLQTLRFVP